MGRFELYTKITPSAKEFKDLQSRSLLIGSCFAETISNHFQDLGLNHLFNPYGTVYHPAAIAAQLEFIRQEKNWSPNEFRNDENHHYHWMVHGDLCSPETTTMAKNLNEVTGFAHEFWNSTDSLIVTLGTAYAYHLKENDQLVANCHKQPAKLFDRRLSSLLEVVETMEAPLIKFLKKNDKCHVVLTVSPIRHLRDAPHENSVSKSVLLLAAHQLVQRHPRILYFPAYEIMLDELRDYRFYQDDMIHPSPLAQSIIAEKFFEWAYDPQSIQVMSEIRKIRLREKHKLNRPESKAAADFQSETYRLKTQLVSKFPFLEL